MKVCIFFCCINLAIILSTESLPEGIREDRSYDVVLSSSERIDVQSLNSPSEISKFVNLGLGSEVESDIPRQSLSSRRDRLLDPEVADQLEGNGWLDVVPGTPGKDYPNYQNIPETSFTCDEKSAGGYYADIEARCQVFHVCNTNGEKSSFMCPSGSIFNQKYFVCDWWYDFECDDATDLYSLNEKINRGGTGSGPSGPGRILIDNEEFGVDKLRGENFDLSLAGTGEGNIGYGKNKNGYESDVKVKDLLDVIEKNDQEKSLIIGTKRGNDNNNNNNNDKDEYEIQENNENEKRRSESINWGRKRSRKEGRIAIENQRGNNYESRGIEEEGRDNFRTGNYRRRDREFDHHSRGFKKEFLDRRGNYESNNANGDNDRSSEYRSSSISPTTNKTEEIITRRVDSRIKENRGNGFRENNYSSGDYLLGVIMEDEYRGNRSSSHNNMQRRRFLPIL